MILDTLNLLVSCGVLWKLIEFSREYGRLEGTVEGLNKIIHEQLLPFRRREGA